MQLLDLSVPSPITNNRRKRSAGEAPPRIAMISRGDVRVVPEENFGLTSNDAIVFRSVAGLPQGYWKDLIHLWPNMAMEVVRRWLLFIILVSPYDHFQSVKEGGNDFAYA